MAMQDTVYDVLVCGSGPAGVGAAVAAGRGGARVLLIERLGHLGGMHTSAGVVNWCDTPGGPVFDELFARMQKLDAAHYRMDPEKFIAPGRAHLDTELSKSIMMQMVLEARVEVLLMTVCDQVRFTQSGCELDILNKSGRQTLRARVIIDATGDGDIAAAAGASFMQGDPQDGRIQHCNFRVWYEGVEGEAARRDFPDQETLLRLLVEAQANGEITPPEHLFQPQAKAFPFNERTGQLQLSNWEFELPDSLDTRMQSKVLAQCQVAAMQMLAFCRKHLPHYQDMRLVKLPSVLGVRESRRMRGRYLLTKADVLAGRKFDDGIARGQFFMDLHDSPPGASIPHSPEHIKSHRPADGDWYEIPYRCLQPEGIERLLVAGRCISTDRDAHGSTRAMTTCMSTGTAAGAAAALAVKRNLALQEVEAKDIRAAVEAIRHASIATFI